MLGAFADDVGSTLQGGTMIGTHGYLAPQLARAWVTGQKAMYNSKVDMFSVGMVAVALFARIPINRDTHVDQAIASLQLSRCSREIKALVVRMLSEDQNQRPSAAEASTLHHSQHPPPWARQLHILA